VSTLTLSKLESHLWEAANILRGPVDAADFKTYVFPLLFFKRISDMQDEEYDAAMMEFDGDEESALFPEDFWCHEPRISRMNTNESDQRFSRFVFVEIRAICGLMRQPFKTR